MVKGRYGHISDAEARRHVWAACALVMGREGEAVGLVWSQAVRAYLIPLLTTHPSGRERLSQIVGVLNQESYGEALELALAWWVALAP